MPIEHAIWTVSDTPVKLAAASLPSEAILEQMIINRPETLSPEWMLIGQQVQTDFRGKIDLLAIAPDASLVLIELKRDRTPRDVVAQALDYASWVDTLDSSALAEIYQRFSNGASLAEAFKARFKTDLKEEDLNRSHQIVIVSSELDQSTERIIQYLSERDIAINAVFFRVLKHGAELLLSRAWMLDPTKTQINVAQSARPGSEGREPWIGEYYVSYGSRSWEDARKFGFISGGGGSWYSRTLGLLNPGDRIWVKIPGTGYVGVGHVRDPMQPILDLTFQTPSGPKPAAAVLEDAEVFKAAHDDPDQREYAVTVDWLDTVPESQAFNEVGLFGNQNTVCRPSTPRWRHTVERLKSVFKRWDAR